MRLDRRFGNYFNGTVSYSFQQAKNTGSDPFTYINYGSRIVNQVGGNNGAQPPPQGILPTDDSRPHALDRRLLGHLPGRFQAGHGARRRAAQRERLHDLPVHQRHRVHQVRREPRGAAAFSRSRTATRLFPEGINTQRLPAFKELNARFTKSFGLGGLDMTGYLDVRNLLNFKNVLQVFAVNGDTRNEVERAANLDADLDDLAIGAGLNGAMAADGAIDLTFAAADRRTGCDDWVSSKNDPAAANCIYLIRAEQRYGNGDDIYHHRRADQRHQRAVRCGSRRADHTAPGRRARLGFEINF